jgi:hypothetical protein
VLVAVDDVQWLDAASALALGFVARRLPPRVGLLLTRRGEGGMEAPLGLSGALPEARVNRLVAGPLSLAALHHLIRSRLGTSMSHPLLARLVDASGGNPFFALEIARALERDADERALNDPLPVPKSLQVTQAFSGVWQGTGAINDAGTFARTDVNLTDSFFNSPVNAAFQAVFVFSGSQGTFTVRDEVLATATAVTGNWQIVSGTGAHGGISGHGTSNFDFSTSTIFFSGVSRQLVDAPT